MDRNTVFTKTAKGITQVNQKSASLSKDLMKVLKLIDGKSNFGQIMEKADLDKAALEKNLNTLTKDGYARVFQVRKEEADPFAGETDRGERTRRAAKDGSLLEPSHHRRRDENEWLAVGFGLHIGRDCHLADIELELAHHRLEESIRRLDVGKCECDAR